MSDPPLQLWHVDSTWVSRCICKAELECVLWPTPNAYMQAQYRWVSAVCAWLQALHMEGDIDELSSGGSDDDDAWLEDEEDDYLTPQQRAKLECGVLQHDAHFFVDDAPTHHPQVPSSTCHHQTADACAFLPRPAEAAATAGGSTADALGTSVSGDTVPHICHMLHSMLHVRARFSLLQLRSPV